MDSRYIRRDSRIAHGTHARVPAASPHPARRNRSRLTPTALAACLGAAFAAMLLPGAAMAQLSADVPRDPVLNTGDHVRLIVWRNAEMSGEFEVLPDSTLGHPLLRQVKIAGISVSAAEERLRVALGRFEANPNIVLLPQFRVLILGGVNSPGFRALSPNVSIAEAVLLAGPTDRARLDRIRVVRAGQEYVINLARLNAPEGRTLIRSGDQILVEERRSIRRDVIVPVITFLGSVTAILNFASRF